MKTKITFFRNLKIYLFILSFIPVTGLLAQTFEAENVVDSSYVSVNTSTFYSGGKAVSVLAAHDGYLAYEVTAPTAGTYDMAIDYVTMQDRAIYVKVNEQIPTVVDSLEFTGNWDGSDGKDENDEVIPGIRTVTIQIYLKAGVNVIRMGAFDLADMGFSPNIDKFTISASAITIAEPMNQIIPIVLEAEAATSVVGAQISDYDCYSGGKGVTNMDGGQDGKVVYNNLNIATAGTYDLTVYYTTFSARKLYAKVNGQVKKVINCQYTTADWNCPAITPINQPAIFRKTVQVYMEAGNNVLTVGAYDGWGPNVDRIEIVKSGLQISKLPPEIMSPVFDYTDNALKLAEQNVTSIENQLKLIDNNEYTEYVVSGVTSTKVVVKLAYPIVLSGYAIACSHQDDPAILNDWVVEYSTDSIHWSSVGSALETNTQNYRKVRTGFSPNNDPVINAQYYRLTATGTTDVKIGEWQLFGLPFVSTEQNFPNDDLTYDLTSYADISNYATGDPTGFDRGGSWNEVFENVFDKSAKTKYTVVGGKTFVIQYEPSDAITLKSYALSVHYTTEYASRNPKSWKIEGYDALSAEWKELDVRENIIFPEYGSTMMFNLKDTALCYVYKLSVTANNGSNDTHLCQWQMFKKQIKSPVDISTGIKSPTAENKLKVSVFTNKGQVIINSFESDNFSYQIFNTVGQLVNVGKCVTGRNEITMSKGMYIVKIADQKTKVIVK